MECRVYVRYLLAGGRSQEALGLLGEMERAARSGGRNSRLIIALIWKAIAGHALHREDVSLAALAEAIRLAAPEDLCRVFLDAAQPAVTELLPKVRAFAPAFVDGLLDATSPDRFPGLFASSSSSPAPVGSALDRNQSLPEPLTARELEVLRLLAGGLSYRQIAAELIVALGTVQAHCGSIYGKLRVNNRTQALTRARELHLL
jgi:LuxR family maltose regulon positive regulatory protein